MIEAWGRGTIKIIEDNGITIPELSNKIGVTERTIEPNLKKLQEQKKLTHVGGAKGGHWELIDIA